MPAVYLDLHCFEYVVQAVIDSSDVDHVDHVDRPGHFVVYLVFGRLCHHFGDKVYAGW